MSKLHLKMTVSQTLDGKTEKTQTETTAVLKGNAENFHLTYIEALDLGSSKTTVCVEDGVKVTIDRSGDYGMHMIFEKGEVYASRYVTPYGELELTTFCSKLSSDFENGKLHFRYAASIGAETLGEFDFKFDFSKAEGN